MTTSSVLRKCTAPLVAQSRRLSSSSVQLNAKHNLSPEKLRSLVSLYHNSEDFITPETLDQRIDAAFIDTHTLSSFARKEERSFETLVKAANYRLKQPRLGPATALEKFEFNRGVAWSSQTDTAPRARRTSAALLGVDTSGLPGLEVLKEEEERIQQWVRDHADEIKTTAANVGK
jgi:hypothetical protein